MSRRPGGPCAGFTLIEAAIALALLVVVLAKLTMMMNSAARSSDVETKSTALDDQARIVLDKVAFAIAGASRESLIPDPESPLYSSELRYELSLGVQDGEVVWTEPEAIRMSNEGGQVIWSQNPGAADERRVVWCNIARPLLEGELPNGQDDNGNGLVDENGLTFVVRDDLVEIRLTLERTDSQGVTYTHTVETAVTCRN